MPRRLAVRSGRVPRYVIERKFNSICFVDFFRSNLIVDYGRSTANNATQLKCNRRPGGVFSVAQVFSTKEFTRRY